MRLDPSAPFEPEWREREHDSLELGSQLDAFLRNAADAMLVVDADGTIVFANPQAALLFGYTEDELVRQSMRLIVPESLGDENTNRLAALLQLSDPAARSSGIEVGARHRDGARLDVEIALTPLGPGHRDLAVWTLRDVAARRREARRARRSESRFNEAQRIAKIGNWEWDVAPDVHWWSDELYRMLEIDPSVEERFFDAFMTRIHPDDRDRFNEVSARVLRTRQPEVFDVRIRLPSGEERIVQSQGEVEVDEAGRAVRMFGTLQDVTERKRVETALLLSERLLRESEDRYSSTVELASIGIAHVDTGGRFVWVNQHLCDMLGYSKTELLGRTIKQLSHPEDAEVADKIRADLHAGRVNSLKIEKRYLRKDGTAIWVRITSTLRRDAAGNALYDIAAVEDVTDYKAAEARVQYLATHDEMTGLPNRGAFNELMSQAIVLARARERKCALLFIDLDRFKVINDSLGHEAGDQLLIEMADRLKQCLRKSDLVARLGGDEFVVLLEDLHELAEAGDLARRVLSAVLKPVRILNQECRVTASIGIAVYPEDARDAASLMKHADMAMYSAKEEGKNTHRFYSPQDTPLSVEHFALESHLNHALERDEFTIQYQARVDLKTGTITGSEALLRWWNHELGTVSPTQFIPLAEDTGLIVPIGKWILGAACAQNVAWQRRGLPPIVVAVNLSPRQFKDADLLADITEALERTGMAPELLELEITEGVIMHDAERAAERVAAIKRLGVRLAIDDFGTGYSSLSQLKRFPIDTLKVDRSFIRDIPQNSEDKAITEAIISLGRTLGVTVVAEGVETAAQVEFLRDHGCDEMQGFYFSRPCHPDALAALLATADAMPGALATDR